MNDERAWDRALIDAANQDALEFQSTHQPTNQMSPPAIIHP